MLLLNNTLDMYFVEKKYKYRKTNLKFILVFSYKISAAAAAAASSASPSFFFFCFLFIIWSYNSEQPQTTAKKNVRRERSKKVRIENLRIKQVIPTTDQASEQENVRTQTYKQINERMMRKRIFINFSFPLPDFFI